MAASSAGGVFLRAASARHQSIVLPGVLSVLGTRHPPLGGGEYMAAVLVVIKSLSRQRPRITPVTASVLGPKNIKFLVALQGLVAKKLFRTRIFPGMALHVCSFESNTRAYPLSSKRFIFNPQQVLGTYPCFSMCVWSTSLIRKRLPLGPCNRLMPRALR